MPIDRKMYHPKWELISRLIRFHRAQNCCEVCGVRNYSAGYWDGDEWQENAHFATYKDAAEYRDIHNQFERSADDPKIKVIILTTAHLDHDPRNNRFGNLKAMCQRCHFSHDRQDNARRQRYGKRIYLQTTLF